MSSSSVLESREREQSILDRLPQVRLLAQKLHRRCPANVLLEDLVSAGVTGLVEAANRFDGSRNIQFKTLAEHRIRRRHARLSSPPRIRCRVRSGAS